MLDPYRMVFVNVIALFLVTIGTIIYTYIYPKKKVNLLVLLIIISLLPIISILRKGSYESGGFADYVKFAMSFYSSLTEGNLVPQWDGPRAIGYGSPVFMFMYILPFYIIAFFHWIGLTFIGSLKLLLGLGYFFSGIAMYAFIKNSWGEKAGFIAAIFYLFAPYHLVDLHFRNDVGEVLCFIFVPLLFLATKKIIETGSSLWITLGSVTLSLLIMSHQAISLTSLPFIFVYGLLIQKNISPKKRKYFLSFIFSLVFGILFTAFYWMPILGEAKNIFWGKFGNVSFIEPWTLFFYSPWKGGFLYQGHYGELSFLLGYIHWFVIMLSLFWIIKKKIKDKEKFLVLFSFLSVVFLFIMMQGFSKPIWDITPIINKFQFSYRFLLLIAFFSSILAAFVIKNLKTQWIILLCFTTISITIFNWGHRTMLPDINDAYLQKELYASSSFFEVTNPVWVDYKKLKTQPKSANHIQSTKGEGEITEIKRTSIYHEYLITAKTPLTLQENTYYFNGWNVIINNKSHPFEYKNSNGLISFSLPKGMYKAEIIYEETNIVKIAKLISIASLIIFILIFGRKKLFFY